MKIRIPRTALVLSLTPLLVALTGSEPRPARLILEPASRLTVEGTSNLHDWSCSTSSLDASIRVQLPDDEATPLPLSVDQVSLAVPVAALECKNDKMNKNLTKALDASRHPKIAFRTSGPLALPVPDARGRLTATFRGQLTVAGVTKPIDLPVEAVRTADGSLRITGSKAFLMSQFGIDPPTAMLGVLKTANRVTVRFDLVASPAELASLGADTAAR